MVPRDMKTVLHINSGARTERSAHVKKLPPKEGRTKQMSFTKPPFTRETALAKIKAARDVWNIGAPDNRLEKTVWP
jgi:hypothetical protein